MKIAAIPLKIAWSDRDENLAKVEEYMRNLHSDTDIVVLPELFSTGFIHDEEVMAAMAEPIGGETIGRLAELAKAYNMAIAGSFLFNGVSGIFNRGFFIEPSGEETYYDKRHLFSLSTECERYAAGKQMPPIVRFRGWNIALTICYDLRFPVWCRNKNQAYDIMLVPANWPTVRSYAWERLLCARAIENQAIYVGANRGGHDDYGDYDYLTFIFDAMGTNISNVDAATSVVYATIDKAQLDKVRTRLPFGNDADDYTINID
ncbi:MAG: nitrilase family protein [Muribaculaceae bacterium]|nr:nitrilase family protein [Muribaculaceae bacterium]